MALVDFDDNAERVLQTITSDPDLPWSRIAEQEASGSPLAAANRANAERSAPLPSLDQLHEVMRIAFYATLLEEEGRPTTFTLAYARPDSAECNACAPLRFAEPIPLEPARIAKVAPSAHRTHTMIGVWPGKTGRLEAWGLIQVGDRSFAIDLVLNPLFLKITGRRAGVVAVEYWERVILHYAHGQAHFPSRDEIDLTGLLRDAALPGLVAHEVQRVAERMLLHGHGGAILLVNPGVSPAAVVMHRHYTFAAPNSILKDAFDRDDAMTAGRVERAGNESEGQFAARMKLGERIHRDALDHVARLTAVDGAVLMNTALEVLGYGTTIMTGTETRIALLHLDPRERKEPVSVDLSWLTGNRHRSAAHFCAAQSDAGIAVAVVASQDGALSLFGRMPGGSVLVVRPLPLLRAGR